MSEERSCSKCGGSGEVTCYPCDGKGYRIIISGGEEERDTCSLCWGSGKSTCTECNGRGYII
jgi:DnaJ-class molecular chaperone